MSHILIGGGSGLVGSRLAKHLRQLGHEVRILTRSVKNTAIDVYWDPMAAKADREAIRQADIIINLAGAGIVDKPWTAKQKQLIIDSRVKSTALLAEVLSTPGHRCTRYINASAIGIYGDRDAETLTESSSIGQGFLTDSCVLWEKSATDFASQTGIPTGIVRIGIVLSKDGGAFPKLAMSYPFFVGTYFGDGSGYFSWIHIEDLCRLFIHLIDHKLTGIFNGTAPNPVTQKVLAQAIASSMNRSVLMLPIPALAIKLAMGEMSHTVLDSAKVLPQKAIESGFAFRFYKVEDALNNM
jgi:uncharacterized protein